MATLHKSNSYPERLRDVDSRERDDEKKESENQTEALEKFRQKDFSRAERFATLGSNSSFDPVVHADWRARCCATTARIIDYFLERGEEARRQDEIIQLKSYAGFYYFIKWFVRALFFLLFTTLGTIAGKEVGCEIKDHSTCSSGVVDLVESSPHLVASIIGSIFGILVGQSLGRYVWDHSTKRIQFCLRRIERRADTSKIFLIILSVIVYAAVTTLFAVIFFFFVDFGQDDENVIGGVVGGCIGLVCAVLAYQKSSSCQSGEETPMVNPVEIPNYSAPPMLRL